MGSSKTASEAVLFRHSGQEAEKVLQAEREVDFVTIELGLLWTRTKANAEERCTIHSEVGGDASTTLDCHIVYTGRDARGEVSAFIDEWFGLRN